MPMLSDLRAFLDGGFNQTTQAYTIPRGTVAFPTPEIDRVCDTVLGTNVALALTNATRPQITGTVVRVTGAGSGLFSALTISIDFSVSAQNAAHVAATATTPAGFQFSDRFTAPSAPDLYKSLKAEAGATLSLSSLAKLGEELLYSGRITIGPPSGDANQTFSKFARMVLGGTLTGQVAGPIKMSRNDATPAQVFPEIDLSPTSVTGTDSIPTSLVVLRKAALGFTSQVTRDDKTNQRSFSASLKLVSSLQFNLITAHPAISLTAEQSDPTADVTFSAGINEIISLESIVNFMSVPEVGGLPNLGVPVASQFRWQKIGVTVNPDTLAVKSVSFGVESAQAWNIVQNDITNAAIGIAKVFVTITVLPPGGVTKATVTFGGTLQIGQAQLDVTSSPKNLSGPDSDMSVTVALSGNPALKLSDVLQFFRAGDRAGAADLSVDRFLLTITPSKKTYNAVIAFVGFWPLPNTPGTNGIKLTNLSLSIDFESKKKFAVALTGKVKLGDLEFDISADHPSGGTEWIIKSALKPVIAAGASPKNVSSMIAGIYGHFTLTPPQPPVDFGITQAGVEIRTGSADITFRMKGQFTLEGVQAPLTLSMKMSNAKDVYRETFEGLLELTARQKLFNFDVVFDRQPGQKRFAASLKGGSGATVSLADMIRCVTTQAEDFAPALQNFTLSLKESVFLFQGATGTPPLAKPAKSMIAANMGAGISLTGLTLVGRFFSSAALSVQMIPRAASADFTRAEIDVFRGLLSEKAALLPAAVKGENADQVVKKGAGLDLKTSMNGKLIDAPVPLKIGAQGGVEQGPAAPGTNANDPVFVKVQNTFGPVTVSRFGVKFTPAVAPATAGTLSFIVDAGMSIGPVAVSLDGLSVSSPIDTFTPKFDLKGLGLKLTQPPVDLGGAFLQTGTNEFAGAAVIKFQQAVINAFGAYSEIDGNPSLFVYAVLNYPIGGPSFFFVTGLAAGFGVNRKLIVPDVSQVSNFTMVKDAAATTPGPITNTAAALTAKVRAMTNEIRPSVGDFFFAAGIQFTSFKLVNSFVLLTAQFGRTFEINILGLSKAVIPPQASGKPPIAEVELALRAVIRPDEGFVGVDAQLTPASYLFSHDCKLRGGFSFYCWFKDQTSRGIAAGDFVLSIGGYNPSFLVPGHFPRPTRVGFDWRVDSSLELHGNAYFALLPSMLMAGGELQAIYRGDSITATFVVGADFLLAWKPYHYNASVHVAATVSVTWWFFGTHTTTLEVGADLTIYGPPFGGRGTARLLGISHEITFGAAEEGPLPLTLTEFRSSFLPTNVVSVTLQSGLLRQGASSSELGLLDPTTFMLSIESAVPVTNFTFTAVQVPSQTNPTMRLAPVAGTPVFTSTLEITLTGPATAGFQASRVIKSVPAALWGQSSQPSVNGARLVTGATCGIKLSSVPATASSAGRSVTASTPPALSIAGSQISPPARLDAPPAPDFNEIAFNLRSATVSANRSAVLLAVGFNDATATFEIDGSIEREFLEPPAQLRFV